MLSKRNGTITLIRNRLLGFEPEIAQGRGYETYNTKVKKSARKNQKRPQEQRKCRRSKTLQFLWLLINRKFFIQFKSWGVQQYSANKPLLWTVDTQITHFQQLQGSHLRTPGGFELRMAWLWRIFWWYYGATLVWSSFYKNENA